MNVATIWLICLTVISLIALFRNRGVKYDGDYIVQNTMQEWDMERVLVEHIFENPEVVKKLIGKINEYQLNRNGEIKGYE